MLDIQSLEDKDVGKFVKYTDSTGNTKIGRIKSWNQEYVFVVYSSDENWNNFRSYTAEATYPSDLVFV